MRARCHIPLLLALACSGEKVVQIADTAAGQADTGTEDTGTADTVEPGVPVEWCNGRDDDGDGLVDEGMFGLSSSAEGFAQWQVGAGVAAVLQRTDEWSNGDIDSESTSLYSLDGLILEHMQVESDGSTHTILYGRGAGGRLTLQQYKSNGLLYQEDRYTWEEDQLGALQILHVDEAGSATLSYEIAYTYDGDGYQITQEEDANGDGETNNIVTTTWSSDHRVRTDEYYVVRLASIYQIIRTTTGASGQVISIETDSSADGLYDRVQTQIYDGSGLLVEIQYTMADGGPSSRDTLDYDETGHLLWRNIHMDEDGSFWDSAGYLWEGDQVIEQRERASTEDVWTTWRYTLDPAGNTAVAIEDPDDLTTGGTHTTNYSFTCH
jgi:hypothetical protein